MRKILSLILVLVLCMSLCACGGSSGKSGFVGTWTGTDKNGVSCSVIFKSNGSFLLTHDQYGSRSGEWELFENGTVAATDDNYGATFIFSLNGDTLNCTCNTYSGSPMKFKK